MRELARRLAGTRGGETARLAGEREELRPRQHSELHIGGEGRLVDRRPYIEGRRATAPPLVEYLTEQRSADAVKPQVGCGPEAGEEPLRVAQRGAREGDNPSVELGDAEDAGLGHVPVAADDDVVRASRRLGVVTADEIVQRIEEEIGRGTELLVGDRAIDHAPVAPVYFFFAFFAFAFSVRSRSSSACSTLPNFRNVPRRSACTSLRNCGLVCASRARPASRKAASMVRTILRTGMARLYGVRQRFRWDRANPADHGARVTVATRTSRE